MATHESEAVEPTVELGRKWLEIEARRNCRYETFLYHPKQLQWKTFILVATHLVLCRFITSLNTCGDELVAVCPDMFEVKQNF